MFRELLGSFVKSFLDRMPNNGLTREQLIEDLEYMALCLRVDGSSSAPARPRTLSWDCDPAKTKFVFIAERDGKSPKSDP